MLKSIFCKIMSDEEQRQKMNSLEDKNQIYKLFCENGYTKTYDEFEKEMEVFLNSEDSKKLMNNDFGELSDEMLEMIAGGVNVKRAVTAGIATLLTTFTIGAIGNQILSQSNIDTTSSPTQVVATFDNSSESIEQTSNKQLNNTVKNRTFRFGQRKGPNGNGGGPADHHRGPNGNGGGPADHRIGPNDGGGGSADHRIGPNGGGGGSADHRIGPNDGGGSSAENGTQSLERLRSNKQSLQRLHKEENEGQKNIDQETNKQEAVQKLFNIRQKQENQLKKDALNKLKEKADTLKQQANKQKAAQKLFDIIEKQENQLKKDAIDKLKEKADTLKQQANKQKAAQKLFDIIEKQENQLKKMLLIN